MQTGTRRYLARPGILHLHGVTGAMGHGHANALVGWTLAGNVARP